MLNTSLPLNMKTKCAVFFIIICKRIVDIFCFDNGLDKTKLHA